MIFGTQILESDYLPVQTTGKVVMGKDVQRIQGDKLWMYAKKISDALTEHPSTMVQKDPGKLLDVMNQGRAILYLEVKTADLLGFGQLWLYKLGDNSKDIYEFGSWLSFKKGAGKVVLAAARDLSLSLFPGSQLVALIEPENKKAQSVIEQLVGIPFEWATSHLLEKGPTLMKKYDITKRISI